MEYISAILISLVVGALTAALTMAAHAGKENVKIEKVCMLAASVACLIGFLLAKYLYA